MARLFAWSARRTCDHRSVFAAFADGLARMLAPRRTAARVRPLGDRG